MERTGWGHRLYITLWVGAVGGGGGVDPLITYRLIPHPLLPSSSPPPPYTTTPIAASMIYHSAVNNDARGICFWLFRARNAIKSGRGIYAARDGSSALSGRICKLGSLLLARRAGGGP